TLNNLGNLHSAKNELEDAEKEYQEALEIRRNLAKTNPQVYQISLAETLNNYAFFYLYSKPEKEKSLGLSSEGFLNAYSYQEQVPYAFNLCQMSIQIWEAWGEDLIKYLTENQSTETN
ncbi:tetratricopeptide repeat protein, partial [Emticicia fluvialis]|uniref:tetratricopeptide repeat protein n=1 Tax=Emticicia fluvialis TaxID=2974474 RepID=UPI002165D135